MCLCGRYVKVFIILVFTCQPVDAVTVEATINNGVVISADYISAGSEKPAVLVLHGFLSTRHFFTVARITEYLADDGFNVLAPTLSLGISKRKQSLSCDALHTHDMQSDLMEISFWVEWLEQKGYRQIYLVGHSYGSLQLIIYQAKEKRKSVKRVIATSLVDIEHTMGSGENQSQLLFAKQQVNQKNSSLGRFKLSFCKNYASPPAAFLSYAMWNKVQIIELLKALNTPVNIIMGSSDRRMDQAWPDMLKQVNANVLMINGANHFFDAQYEFDLVDTVLSILNKQ